MDRKLGRPRIHDVDLVQFKLRMDETLRQTIEDAAEASGRSMNAEIVRRLEQSFAVEAVRTAVREEVEAAFSARAAAFAADRATASAIANSIIAQANETIERTRREVQKAAMERLS